MNVFITGVTGFLGSHFLFQRLGRSGLAAVLVRAETAEAARDRVKRSLHVAATAYTAASATIRCRISVELGELSSASGGVSPRRIDALREGGIDEFWHFAASLAFEERRREAIAAQNVGGALNALELATRLGARRFVYVSTAYTAGRRTGIVPETLHPTNAEFNNVYEETKCRAEHVVASAAAVRGIDHRILRPAIVVGSSRTAGPAGSTTGLYGFIRMLYELRRSLTLGSTPIRLKGDPTTPLHLVPVDRVVRDMLDLADREFPGGPIYHLVPRRSIEVATALEIVCREVRTPGVQIGKADCAERTPLERILDEHMGFYGGYLRDPKIFVRSLPGDCEVGVETLERLTREYLRELGTGAARLDRPSAGASRTSAPFALDRTAVRL
jgi:nucleoside-diphosphate-sugar epimerase